MYFIKKLVSIFYFTQFFIDPDTAASAGAGKTDQDHDRYYKLLFVHIHYHKLSLPKIIFIKNFTIITLLFFRLKKVKVSKRRKKFTCNFCNEEFLKFDEFRIHKSIHQKKIVS